jgi:hypothetical protein
MISKKKIYGLIAATAIIAAIGGVRSSAIGPSPAFDGYKINDEERRAEITAAVSGELDKILPKVNDVYKETLIHEKFHTNYQDIGYPSINDGNNEGITEDNKIDVNSLKKPITEPSKRTLAEQVRFYQFNFTNGLHYTGIDPADGHTQDFEAENKLNFFDYVNLIESIRDNPSYSKSVKEKKLTVVEEDLQSAIDLLYGGNKFNNNLKALDQVKSVSIPFNYNKYSYLQLLAAYDKDEAINATLSYYSEIIDTLNTIRLYSAGVRQGKDVSLNTAVLADKLNQKYNVVQEKLIEPIVKVVDRDYKEQQALKAGESLEKEQLSKEFKTIKE